MRSPAAAFAWELFRRHRWGLAGVGLYFLFLATLRLLVLGVARITFAEPWQFAAAVVVPLAGTFTYFLAIFTFGLEGDLAGRRSTLPTRRFTLPVTSAALAGWPMLYGGMAMAMLWLGTRALALWPTDVHVPVLWPALFAAVFLAWTQGLTWMPYPLPGLRVLLAVGWLGGVGLVALLAVHLRVPEGVMLALLAPQWPLAFLVARYAVTRARRGEGGRNGRAVQRALRARRAPFSSPERAQAWFEWRQSGRSLPIAVALVLPFELSLLFVFRDTPSLLKVTVTLVLLTPPGVAAFATEPRALPTFLGTRPLRSAALLRAKWVAALWSTGAAWLLVALALPTALWLSGTAAEMVDGLRHLAVHLGTPRATVLALLVVTALVAATWKQRVHGLYAGLSAHPWAARARVFGTLVCLTLLVLFLPSLLHSQEGLTALGRALPWILAVLAVIKVGAAAWIATAIQARGLLPDRSLVLDALAWSAAVLALHGVLVWLLPSVLFPHHMLVLVAILAIPRVRLAAALLALSGSRHR